MSETIETSKYNGTFIIKVGNRIDTSNVNKIQEEVLEAVRDLDKDTHLILDFTDLEYISSAGLRMIMLVKRNHSDMELINVALEPYEVFEVTGFSQVIPITKKKKEIDITNLENIGAGKPDQLIELMMKL